MKVRMIRISKFLHLYYPEAYGLRSQVHKQWNLKISKYPIKAWTSVNSKDTRGMSDKISNKPCEPWVLQHVTYIPFVIFWVGGNPDTSCLASLWQIIQPCIPLFASRKSSPNNPEKAHPITQFLLFPSPSVSLCPVVTCFFCIFLQNTGKLNATHKKGSPVNNCQPEPSLPPSSSIRRKTMVVSNWPFPVK